MGGADETAGHGTVFVATRRRGTGQGVCSHARADEHTRAQALVAQKLYKSLAKEAADDYLEVEVCDSLKQNAE